MSLRATIRAAIAARYVGAADLGDANFDLPFAEDIDILDGTGDYECDLLFADRRTLAASATENLDLAGGLEDPHGAALTFAKVKAILVRASAENTNNVVVGGAGSNTFTGPFADATDKIAVKPGGVLMLAAPEGGWTVTAGTGDILLVANSGSGTGVTFDIVILGSSA